jgi:hypothetical protein
MKQTILFTALPLQVSGATPRIGVFVSPRLEPDATTTLATFPTFLHWPKSLLSSFAFEVQIDGVGTVKATLSSQSPDEGLWDSLFKSVTTVRAFEVKPLHDRTIRSFPTTAVIGHLQGLYRAVAEASPASHPVYVPGKDNGAVGALVDFIGQVGPLGQRFAGIRLTDTTKLGRNGGMGPSLGAALYKDRKVIDFNSDYAGGGSASAIDFALAYSFHDRPGRQTSKAAPAFAKVVTPEFEFHEIVASLGNYPEILRRIGLVFELDLQMGGASLPSSGRLRVKPTFASAPGYNVAADQPWTHYETKGGRFIAQSKPGGDLDGGMLLLEGAGEGIKAEFAKNKQARFALVQVDADGAAMKAVDFAINLHRLSAANMRYTHGETEALPALRSSGIGLVRHNRAYNIHQNLQAIAARNTTFTSGGSTELWLDDVLRGYRVDVQDADGKWFSLMARDGFYRLTAPDAGYAGANPLLISDEGYVKGSSASSDLEGGPDLYLHESMFRWEGWSLTAPRPGKAIVRDETPAPGSPAEVPEHRVSEAAGAHVHMEANFRATPKTLPRLRFGDQYRMRVRTVDLGGYGPRLDDAPVDAKYLSNALRYARFEPVSQPFVIPRARLKEGEANERLVIRSNYDQSAVDYTTFAQTKYTAELPSENDRWLAPPKTSELTAESHKMFDEMLKAGMIDEAYNLARKEEGTFLDVEIVNPADPGTPIPVVGSKILNSPATPVYVPGEQEVKRKVLRASEITDPANEEVWKRGEPLAPGQYVVHPEDQLLLPYLPDPIARGCAIEGLRDVTGNGAIPGGAAKVELPPFGPFDRKYNVVKIPFDGTWPDRKPFRLLVKERPGTMQGDDCLETFTDATLPPSWDEANRVLTVFLGKAETMRLLYSSYLDKDDLHLMGIWSWLDGSPRRNDFEPYGMAGQAWMVTPHREIVLVHAVQQPLCAPKIVKYASNKQLGKTFATFEGQFQLNVPSTGRIDVRGKWTEWVDPLNEKGPKQIEGSAQAYFFDVPETAPNNLPVPPNIGKPLTDFRHEFNDTRYRKIDYWLIATSRFREYVPERIWIDPANITREGKPFTNVKVLNSARPEMPKILYVVPTFGWERPEAPSGSEIVSRRCGGGLRVYIDRPWYSSGDEELLGIVLPPAGSIGDDSPLKPYVTQWGMDPAWSAYPTYSTVQIGHFKSFEKDASGVTIDEIPGQKVNVVGYTPGYDDVRRLWYCDIEVDTGPAYYPFIRLGLCRFQPNSVPDAHLSRVVLADFVQLAADRAASVVFESENVATVFVSGVYGMNEATVNAEGDLLAAMRYSRTVTAALEEQESAGGADGEEESWRPVSNVEQTLTPTYEKEFKLKLLWHGRVPLPGRSRRFSGGSKVYRIVVKEWEYFDADPERGGATKMDNGRWMGRRLVYADVIEI